MPSIDPYKWNLSRGKTGSLTAPVRVWDIYPAHTKKQENKLPFIKLFTKEMSGQYCSMESAL